MKPFILGTRGSELALAQTRQVAALLRAAHPGLAVEERIIRTTGDARLDVSLSAPGPLDKGLFTKELEDALLRREIDAAVHSLKDLPTAQPPGLVIGAVLEREKPEDVLVSKSAGGLDALSHGAAVATSSLRRKCFLRWQRHDLELHDIRGNVPTRLRKLRESETLSALVLAGAGLRRLQAAGCELPLDGLSISPLDLMLPAPGQGAIAIECRSGDAGLLTAIHHAETAVCVQTERAVLAGLEGGCSLPVGARATVHGGMLALRAVWFANPTHASEPPRIVERAGRLSEWRDIAAEAVAALLD
jgi:hydroxymethylbilane synthase